MLRVACACLVIACGAAAACTEDVVARFAYACTTSAGCGPGYACDPSAHRCVPVDQLAEVTTSEIDVAETHQDTSSVETSVPETEVADAPDEDVFETADDTTPIDSATAPDGDASDVSEVEETEVQGSCATHHGPGCPCAGDGDCADGSCIEDLDGPVCATPCETTCADGRECHHPIAGGAGFCVTPHAKLCRPCRTHAECDNQLAGQRGACVESDIPGLGGFCATSCKSRGCPEGFRCLPSLIGTDSGCVPDEAARCECRASWAKLGYETGCADGECAGTRRCTATGLGACDALCDDGLSCTLDTCAPAGCGHAIAPSTCLIDVGGTPTCFAAGDVNPADSCLGCDASHRTSWAPRPAGSACGSAGMGVCTSEGLCVGCLDDGDCASGRCDEASNTCDVWPFGDDGDLDIASGATVTLVPGTHKDYRNVTIHDGGTLRLSGLGTGLTVIGIRGALVLDGTIDASGAFTSALAAQVLTQAPGPDGSATGEQLAWTPVQARGGAGGGGSGRAGSASQGNGGGGAGGLSLSGGACETQTPGNPGSMATSTSGGDGGTPAAGGGSGGTGAFGSMMDGVEGASGTGGGGAQRGKHGGSVFIRVGGAVSGHGSVKLVGRAGGIGGSASGSTTCTCPPTTKAGCPGGGGAGGNGGMLVRRGTAWPAGISIDVRGGLGGAPGLYQTTPESGCQCRDGGQSGLAGTDGVIDGP